MEGRSQQSQCVQELGEPGNTKSHGDIIRRNHTQRKSWASRVVLTRIKHSFESKMEKTDRQRRLKDKDVGNGGGWAFPSSAEVWEEPPPHPEWAGLKENQFDSCGGPSLFCQPLRHTVKPEGCRYVCRGYTPQGKLVGASGRGKAMSGI
uniref:Uncharacterized protein n=1 Tax=Micrurus corallinus TaxID=54390 RepID=A0A2D4FKM7_MICCO